MKKFKKIKFYLVSFFLLLPCILNAEKIGLLPFKQVGIESNIIEAIYQLMESELSSYGHIVIPPDKIAENIGEDIECYNKQCAAEIGIQMGLERVIFGSLTKIGEKYIVSAIVVESQSGEILFSDKVTSQTAEDLDVCVFRLVKSIQYGKDVEKTAEVGKITEEEMETGVKRKKAFFASGLGFGMGMPVMGYGDPTDNTINYYGFKTWYETPRLAAEVDWYLGTSGIEINLNEWALGISLIYFFTTTDFSPYLSLGVARKSITVGYFDYTSGLALETGGGIVVFRTYDFRLVIDGRLSTSFNTIGDLDGPHSALKIGINLLYKKEKGGSCFGF
jgi:hypothetical protein